MAVRPVKPQKTKEAVKIGNFPFFISMSNSYTWINGIYTYVLDCVLTVQPVITFIELFSLNAFSRVYRAADGLCNFGTVAWEMSYLMILTGGRFREEPGTQHLQVTTGTETVNTFYVGSQFGGYSNSNHKFNPGLIMYRIADTWTITGRAVYNESSNAQIGYNSDVYFSLIGKYW